MSIEECVHIPVGLFSDLVIHRKPNNCSEHLFQKYAPLPKIRPRAYFRNRCYIVRMSIFRKYARGVLTGAPGILTMYLLQGRGTEVNADERDRMITYDTARTCAC